MEFWASVQPRIAEIETALRERFAAATADVPAALREAMSYSLFAGGKRLRPLLCGWACEAAGGEFQQSLAAGTAVEMVHTYSLIHDDLPAMDDDDLRRGRPTCHKVYGEAMAILAGDGLLTLAFEILGECYDSPTAAVGSLELARGAGGTGMVGGQVLDLQADGRIAGDRPSDERGLESIHRRKTGALIRSVLRLGVYAAGRRETAAIDRYAEAFGLLFQVTDDLLDATGSAEQAGKKTGKDSARGKLTYPGLLGIDASREKARQLARDAVLAAESFGERGRVLAELANYVVQRDR